MTAHESLNDLLLLDYTTGALSEAESLIVATHVALNPAARSIVRDMETIGGSLLNSCEPADISAHCLDTVLEQIDRIKTAPTPKPLPANASTNIPEPLRSYLPAAMLDTLEWSRMFKHIQRHDIQTRNPSHRVRLMKLEPGVQAPHHSHDGVELTVVLEGAYEDEYGTFQKGDLSILADDSPHAPVSCPKNGCICLTVTAAPLHMTNPFGRMVNAFLRF